MSHEMRADDYVVNSVPLFDGETLKGWRSTGNPEGWAVEDGYIVCLAKGGGYLYTEEQFEAFILTLEYKIGPKVNSGVFVRMSDVRDPVHTGIEVQILDHAGRDIKPVHRCGALYDMVAPSVDAMKPVGEWNHHRITCRGPVISVELNGIEVARMNLDDYTEPGKNPDGTPNKFKYAWKDMPRKGHIALQDHGSMIWFRNIRIQELA